MYVKDALLSTLVMSGAYMGIMECPTVHVLYAWLRAYATLHVMNMTNSTRCWRREDQNMNLRTNRGYCFGCLGGTETTKCYGRTHYGRGDMYSSEPCPCGTCLVKGTCRLICEDYDKYIYPIQKRMSEKYHE